ncbi:TIGR04255 family protein [Rhizobium sp. L245/93]|uniref:TIGR04255 family protein n=1 Tax=Rhizobium sp. L245/93 TaxID=2819998 RepID=UPI001AD9F11D|nr:TIGR04255 family protein [Rhizobium sp. L245/93]MBO9168416.1 TIGR04255 family protein [Rhizobium sp. L245/93]
MLATQEYQRVVYNANPLAEVICQLRFPKLLQIDASPPARFQMLVMGEYPHLEERDSIQIDVSPQSASGPIQRTKSYHFTSDDGHWSVTLASDFIALTATKYTRWEDFRARLRVVTGALLEEYHILHFSRIGLRYRDVIDPSQLGMYDVAWKDLIQPTVLGVVGADMLHRGEVLSAMSSTVMKIDGVHTVLHAGLLDNNATKQKAFLIDTDFSIDGKIQPGADHAIESANRLHELSGPVFRWCITDKLHDHLKPQAV